MAIGRCVRCDSTNVDFEGYCWNCEYQHPGDGQEQGAVDGVADRPAPRRPAATGARRSGLTRFLVMTVAPITTLLVIGCLYVAVVAFERADAVVGAHASPDVAASGGAGAGADGDAAACVVGRWQLVATDAVVVLGGGSSFHGTGAGGTLTLAKDGTGTFDYTGWSISGIMSGATVTMTAAGVETFRYRLESARMTYQELAGAVTATVQAHGQTLLSEPVQRSSTQAENAVGCAGGVLTAKASRKKTKQASSDKAGGDGGFASVSETYSRLG